MEWTAYCIECERILAECENGNFAEAAGRIHIKSDPYHDVIVGYFIGDLENKKETPMEREVREFKERKPGMCKLSNLNRDGLD